jgi:hypothetical protein
LVEFWKSKTNPCKVCHSKFEKQPLTFYRMSRPSEILPNRGQGPLAIMLRDAQIEWPAKTHSYFIPIDKINVLEDSTLVRVELRRLFPDLRDDRVDHYVKVICTEAKRIFAIILSSSREIQREIRTFIDEGIRDVDLPLVRVNKKGSTAYTLATKDHDECFEEGHLKCGIKAVAQWVRSDIQNLCRDQWLAQAPVFGKGDKEIPHYTFDKAVVLPFTEDEENEEGAMREGGYSEVWGVRIHPEHQTVLKITDSSV